MRYSHLSKKQIWEALSQSYATIAAVTKYQAFLVTGAGLPEDDTARVELMVANIRVVEKIQAEIRALEEELTRVGYEI
jgi:hypothetical protein